MEISKFTVAEIIIVIIFAGAVAYFYLSSGSEPVALTDSVVRIEESNNSDPSGEGGPIALQNGWEMYADAGLGYGFSYPRDWSLSPDPDTNTTKQRQEQMVLQKGSARVLIDPLGRRGAQGFSSPIEKFDITVGDAIWQHIFWPPQEYHRFTDANSVFPLKSDQTVDGTHKIGGADQPYTYRSNFRVHVYLAEVATDEERREVMDTVLKILGTLGHL